VHDGKFGDAFEQESSAENKVSRVRRRWAAQQRNKYRAGTNDRLCVCNQKYHGASNDGSRGSPQSGQGYDTKILFNIDR
jgi:hypothetical protein